MLRIRRFTRFLALLLVVFWVFAVIFFFNSSNVDLSDSGPNLNDEFSEMYRSVKFEFENDSRKIPDISEWDFPDKYGNGTLIGQEIYTHLNNLNDNYQTMNVDDFGEVQNVETVIVIQVHNRPAYLMLLIESLKSTIGIEKSLLVFSHDINVPIINEMIRNITFARVHQIYYPFTTQLFSTMYPGQSQKDCAEKIGKENAESIKCENWKYPDKYGNYRVAKLTQIKHHWWWKMNYVFDGIIERFSLQNSWVLLLEEDHFVAPDALHVLNHITKNKSRLCAKCDLISLGFYLKSTKNYGNTAKQLGIHPWYSSKHNMGMALQSSTWKTIKNCSDLFCKFDDYNWDWSLMKVMITCLHKRLVIFTKSPRVLHIGDCGVHTHRCSAHNAYDKAVKLLDTYKDQLFPEYMSVTDVSARTLKPPKENGGWGDSRDHQLCSLNTQPMMPHYDSPVLKNMMESVISIQQRKTTKHNDI